MSLIRFEDFVADPRTGELKRDGRRVRLPRQSFQILVALTRAPGELVTREALQAELWPKTSQVEWEQGLNAAVNRLREALGDSAAEPKFIETLPRRGYRFIGTLTTELGGASASSASAAAAVTTPAPLPAAAPPVTRRRGWMAGVLAGGLVLLGVIAWLQPRRQEPVLRPGQLKPFTALSGEERAPAFSADGTRMVFAWNGDPATAGRFDLYVKTMDSEQLLRITQLPSDWLHAAWSPDGSAVAFTRRLAGATGVYVVPAIGGAERRLAEAAFVSQPFMQLSWAPDGRTIAYATFDASGSHVVHLLDVQSLENRPLANAPECWNAGLPAFSEDGKRLAFVCTTSVGVFTVYAMDVSAGDAAARKPVPILGFPGEPQGLTWGADRSSLIVASDAGEGGSLWRLGLDGGLTRFPFGEDAATPTRAGGRVAYVRARAPAAIWRMNLTAPEPEKTAQRLIHSTRRDVTPQFSADGRRIVFRSTRSGNAEVWMTDAEGANPLRLTQFNGPQSGAPAFCADGKRVALDSRVRGESRLFIVDIEERQPRQVPSSQPALGLPAWSSDCEWLLASDGRAQLYKLPAAGGEAQLFTQRQSYYAQVAGERVIFNVKQDSGVQLWSKPLAGGEETPVEGLPLIGYFEAWAVTPTGVYFTATQNGRVEVFRHDFRSRGTRRLAALPGAPVPGGGLGIAVSRDDRWLLYTLDGNADSDIMLLELK
jgi:Tol biopolymer transport system component/DNA-binding winged helix-turn-helix (wHTH) protein